MPVGYILWDKEFCVLEWNYAAERIFGFKKSEVMGKYGPDLIVPKEVRKQVGEVMQALRQGKQASYAEKNLRHNLFLWPNMIR